MRIATRAWTLAVVSIVVGLVGGGAPAWGNASHHGGSSDGSEARCIRWEPIARDLGGAALDGGSDGSAALDGGSDGGAALDGGSDGSPDLGSHAGQRCVERASLFSCELVGVGAAPAAGERAFLGVSLLALVLAGARRRLRR